MKTSHVLLAAGVIGLVLYYESWTKTNARLIAAGQVPHPFFTSAIGSNGVGNTNPINALLSGVGEGLGRVLSSIGKGPGNSSPNTSTPAYDPPPMTVQPNQEWGPLLPNSTMPGFVDYGFTIDDFPIEVVQNADVQDVDFWYGFTPAEEGTY